MGLLWGWVVSLPVHWVVWHHFWVPRWIQGLGQISGLGLLVVWWGFEQSGRPGQVFKLSRGGLPDKISLMQIDLPLLVQ